MESRINGTLRVLPKRSQDSLLFCESYGSASPKSVDQWIAELLTKDPKEQGQQLNNALDELLIYKCKPEAYLLLADKILHAATINIDLLTKGHLIHSVIFNTAQQDCFDICASIHHKIILMYRSIAESCTDKKQYKERSTALHRAMTQSTDTILFYAQLYRSVANNIWLEQHHLFQLAHQLKLTKFSQPSVSTDKELCISDLYKRALLFSHSRTNKLNYEDIRRIWLALALWVPHIKLKKTSGIKTFFAVNLAADMGLYYASPDPDKEIKNVFGLDCRVLTTHLKKIKDDPEKTNSLPPLLINHLLSAWTQISKRQHSRTISTQSCKISFGLSAAHYLLSGQQDFNDIIEPFVNIETTEEQVFDGEKKDVWAHAHDADRDKKPAPSSEKEAPVIEFSSKSNKDRGLRFQPMECQIINSSDGGFSLKMALQHTQKVLLGDPVIVQLTEDSPWLLSVVRWVEVLSGNKLKLGVEKLSSQVETCAIKLTHKTQGTTLFQRGFLLPDQPEIGQHTSLILSSLTAKPGIKFELLHNGVLRRGQLDKCISNTNVYGEFQYRLFK
ncbi:hypothetical protein ACH42_10530 [Endozoicomonas sp. (ex Bugula neritina AB1)]|nr:hypothetical protein ACH42_10530 [Endozoicomonas sp. (ex Bugula neritina AB1)]